MAGKPSERSSFDGLAASLRVIERWTARGQERVTDRQLRTLGTWAIRKANEMGLEAKIIGTYKAQIQALTASGQDLQQQLDAVRQQLAAATVNLKDAEDVAAEQAAAAELGITQETPEPTITG